MEEYFTYALHVVREDSKYAYMYLQDGNGVQKLGLIRACTFLGKICRSNIKSFFHSVYYQYFLK